MLMFINVQLMEINVQNRAKRKIIMEIIPRSA